MRKKGSQLWEKEHKLNEVKEKRRKLKEKFEERSKGEQIQSKMEGCSQKAGNIYLQSGKDLKRLEKEEGICGEQRSWRCLEFHH